MKSGAYLDYYERMYGQRLRGAGSGPGGSDVKRALITGITGQDGSYLAEFLLAEGLRGLRAWCGAPAPRTSSASSRFATASDLVQADLLDPMSLDHAALGHPSAGGLQPGRAVVRADLVGAAGADRRSSTPSA